MFQDDGKALQGIPADDHEAVIQLLLKRLELSAQKVDKVLEMYWVETSNKSYRIVRPIIRPQKKEKTIQQAHRTD